MSMELHAGLVRICTTQATVLVRQLEHCRPVDEGQRVASTPKEGDDHGIHSNYLGDREGTKHQNFLQVNYSVGASGKDGGGRYNLVPRMGDVFGAILNQ